MSSAADVGAVFVAQQVLEQDPQRVRQRARIVDDGVEPEDVVGTVADGRDERRTHRSWSRRHAGKPTADTLHQWPS